MVAVNDGVDHEDRQVDKLGKYIVLQDAYGNRYTYAQLGRSPRPIRCRRAEAHRRRLQAPARRQDAAPSAAGHRRRQLQAARRRRHGRAPPAPKKSQPSGAEQHRGLRERLFALPQRGNAGNAGNAPASPASSTSCSAAAVPGYETFKGYFSRASSSTPKTMELQPLKVGSKVTAGTVLGRVGKTDAARRRTCTSRSGRPAAARRRSTRSRSSTAGSCSRPPRSTAPPDKNPFTLEPDRRPGPADVEGAARAAGARPTRRSRSTPAVATTSRPARSTAGCWRCSSTWSPGATT